MTAPAVDRTAALEERLDRLSVDVAFVAAEMREQRLRRQMWDELRTDLTPIGTDLMKLAGRELEEVQDFASTEDLLRLLKRLARNTRNIEATLERLESVVEFLDDAGPLAGDAVMKTTIALEELDRRGYFTFAKSGIGVVDRVVTSFTEDDVNQLGDNIVLILQTVKEMTQPEVMELLQRTAHSLEEEVRETPSTLELLRQMRDPEVKRGLARMLRVLRSFSDATNNKITTNE
jgi:uncharacterized protein YjgD (DUF1641 family)